MKKTESILEAYRHGDFHERLNLFCHYRSLRDEFTKIEHNECISPEINSSPLIRQFSEKHRGTLKNAIELIRSKLCLPVP
jgi:hypothetical protein